MAQQTTISAFTSSNTHLDSQDTDWDVVKEGGGNVQELGPQGTSPSYVFATRATETFWSFNVSAGLPGGARIVDAYVEAYITQFYNKSDFWALAGLVWPWATGGLTPADWAAASALVGPPAVPAFWSGLSTQLNLGYNKLVIPQASYQHISRTGNTDMVVAHNQIYDDAGAPPRQQGAVWRTEAGGPEPAPKLTVVFEQDSGMLIGHAL